MTKKGGFSFDFVQRNALLAERQIKGPLAKSTGTTLAAVLFKDGVVLGADTRASAGDNVADKNVQKLHYLAPNIYSAGAGTSADCDHVMDMICAALTLHRYDTGRQTRFITAATLLKNHLQRYQGYVSAAVIVGGVDIHGTHLALVYPDGCLLSMPFGTMGSGSLNAMTVLESDYRDNMSREEAMNLVTRAIRSGIYNDLGSGSNVDLLVVTKDGGEMLRNYQLLQQKTYERQLPVVYAKGPAKVVKEVTLSLNDVIIKDDDDKMDTS